MDRVLWLEPKFKTSRGRLCSVAGLVGGPGHLLFAAAVPGGLYVGSAVAGLTYGAQWALMAASASELFGLAHFGTLYNVLAMGSPAATYLLSARLAGDAPHLSHALPAAGTLLEGSRPAARSQTPWL